MMTTPFTQSKLRKYLENLDIFVRPGQLRAYIAKGLLPNPAAVEWTEEAIVQRYFRIRALEQSARSLDRRVLIMFLERHPVCAAQVQRAMASMVKTIASPERKMKRVDAAERWFAARHGDASSAKEPELPRSWGPPKAEHWKALLQRTDPQVFKQRLGIAQYHAAQLAMVGKGKPYALTDLPTEEILALLMVRFCASREWIRAYAQERRAHDEQSSWLGSLSTSVGPEQEQSA
jgi:hypothetical protein